MNRHCGSLQICDLNIIVEILGLRKRQHPNPNLLDFPARFLFKPGNLLTSHDLEPPTGADILSPEVNTRQRVAPSGAFWLCPHSGVLFLPAKDPTFWAPHLALRNV